MGDMSDSHGAPQLAAGSFDDRSGVTMLGLLYYNNSPPGVQDTEFIEGYADVLKSESCAKLLKLSDKVTLTRAFTARWKNRPVIMFSIGFHRFHFFKMYIQF